MQSSDGEGLCSSGQCLWNLIREHVSESQLPKIHAALGPSLVHRYKETQTEMKMWQKMLQDTQQGMSSQSGTPLPGRPRSALADAPVVKELVRAEVHMLLQTLKERAGRNGEKLLSRYKAPTVSYALGHSPRSASRLSTQSNVEEEIKAVKEDLNTNDMDRLVEGLRSLFMAECEALNQEIRQLRRSIWRQSQRDLAAEPTLGDLKELRAAIQKDLAHYPAPYMSAVKELSGTHRLSSVECHEQRGSSSSSAPNDRPLSTHHPFPQPRPPHGAPSGRTSRPLHGAPSGRTSRPLHGAPSGRTSRPPHGAPSGRTSRPPHGAPSGRTTSSSKPLDILSPSEENYGTMSINETRKTAPPLLYSASASRPSCSVMKQHHSNPPGLHKLTYSYSSAMALQKNSPADKTHTTPHSSINDTAKERRLSVGQGSRSINIQSSAASLCHYEPSKDAQSHDCPGERPKTPNEPQNTALLTPKHSDITERTPSNEHEVGILQGNCRGMGTNGSHQKEEAGVRTMKSKTIRVKESQTQREGPEWTETHYLNRFIQPLPPSTVK